MFCKKWLFLLYSSLHSRLFEVVTSGLSRARLVDDILKSPSDLNSICNLPSVNKMLSIANLRGRKLSRSATSGLGKVGEVFRVKSNDAAIADTSRWWDGISRKALNKQRKDVRVLAKERDCMLSSSVCCALFVVSSTIKQGHMITYPNSAQCWPICLWMVWFCIFWLSATKLVQW